MRDSLARLGRARGRGGPRAGPAEIAARRADDRRHVQAPSRSRCAEIQADVVAKKKQAIDAGGLYVIGTERHESRRIDNQLRGRSGRQGDPGRSKFYLSLEDDLMRIFGSDRMDGVLQKLGLQEGEAITHPWINKALEKAQQKVEARNFDSRKYVLKYDDVMNDQRKVIFEQRIDMMGHEDVSETVADMRAQVVNELVAQCIPPNAYAEQWDTATLKRRSSASSTSRRRSTQWAAEEGIADQEITERLLKQIEEKAKQKEAEFGPEAMRQIEKMVLLQTLDHLWREHLVVLEHLRSVIGFRSYGQRDPLNEYKSESFQLFETMLVNMREAVTGQLMHSSMPDMREEVFAAGGAAADAGPPRRSVHGPGRAGDGRRRAGGGRSARRSASGAAGAAADPAGGHRRQPEGSLDMGQGGAQRLLPLRLGQEIQALPRQARLMLARRHSGRHAASGPRDDATCSPRVLGICELDRTGRLVFNAGWRIGVGRR